MGDRSKIEWLRLNGVDGASWNIVRGCTRVSEECDRCYAMVMAHRFGRPGSWGDGLTRVRTNKAGPSVDWTGVIRLIPESLVLPLRWTRPRRIFVCSTSDLFHPKVPAEHIAAAFGVMAAARRHTFLVLTKRPERAVEWFRWLGAKRGAPVLACQDYARERVPATRSLDALMEWPLPNVHVGVSAGTQAVYNKRVPLLVHKIPAAVKWVSIEPQLEEINLRGTGRIHLDWIVTGGESGDGARPYDVEWARRLIADGREYGIPVFVKQMGTNPVIRGTGRFDHPLTGKGGNPREWPPDLRIREYPA